MGILNELSIKKGYEIWVYFHMILFYFFYYLFIFCFIWTVTPNDFLLCHLSGESPVNGQGIEDTDRWMLMIFCVGHYAAGTFWNKRKQLAAQLWGKLWGYKLPCWHLWGLHLPPNWDCHNLQLHHQHQGECLLSSNTKWQPIKIMFTKCCF